MRALLPVLIVVLASLQPFVAGRLIDHDSFTVMIDDDDAGRSREHNPVPSSLISARSSPSANGSLAAPVSVPDALNERLSAPVAGPGPSSSPTDTTAGSILAAIRSTNSDASSVPHRPAAINRTDTASASRGYLNRRPADRRPSAISIVEEDLVVVPLPNGVAAIAYDLSAVDSFGHGYRTGLRSVPGLRPVVAQQGQEQRAAVPIPDPDLNPDSWLTFQGSGPPAANPGPDLVGDAARDLARTDGASGDLVPASPDRFPVAGDVWVQQWPSGGENAPNEWVQKPAGAKQSSWPDQDATSGRVPGRHFVHLRDGVPAESGQGRDARRLQDGRGVDQQRDGRQDAGHGDRGEHKKQARQPIRKRVGEWRCLETGVGASVQVEKLVCPPGLMIASFGLASLGNPQGTCSGQRSRQPGACHLDLSAALQERCVGKSVCDIESVRAADVQKRCPGYAGDSRAMVEYECRPWVSKPAIANSTVERCQHVLNNGTLKCPEGQAIVGFGFAFFGEIDGSCARGIAPGVCSRNVMTDLTTQCVGRNRCRVEVSPRQFGSACSNSTAPLSLAASFKCGSLAEIVANATRLANQSYAGSTLQFAKGNGSEARSFVGAFVIAVAIISFVV